jgi:hypothetical protein
VIYAISQDQEVIVKITENEEVTTFFSARNSKDFGVVNIVDGLLKVRSPMGAITANIFPDFFLKNLWKVIHRFFGSNL